MNKILLQIIIFSILYIGNNPSIIGQDQTIKGLIKDSISDNALPYSLVIVKNENDSVITSKYSNEMGQYVLKIPKTPEGKLVFRMLGYETKVQSLNDIGGQQQIQLVTLLNKKDVELEAVDIIAESADITKKFDRTVYKIKSSQKANANDLYDILSGLPGVVVDKTNKTIRFKGGQPEVLIDNMPASIIYPKLEMVDIDNIEAVELINRSALYGGEGKGGLVNVTMKKKKKKNSTGAFLSNETAYLDEADRLNLFNNFLNVNSMIGPFLLFNNLTYDNKYNIKKFETKGRQEIDNNSFLLDKHGVSNIDKSHIDNTFGLYIPAESTKLLLAFAYKNNQNKINKTNHYFVKNQSSVYDEFNNEFSDIRNADNYIYHAKLYQEFKKGKAFSFTFSNQRVNGHSDKTNDYTYEAINGLLIDSNYYYSIDESVKTRTTLYDFYYNHPFSSSSRANIHGTIFKNEYPTNTFNYFVNGDAYKPLDKSNKKIMKRTVLGTNYGKRFGDFLIDGTLNYVYNKRTGDFTRYVHSKDTIYEVNIKEYFYSPSIRFSLTSGQANDFNLGYSYTNEIASSESYLTYIDKQNPHTWKSGNPSLKPEYYHKAYFSYRYTKPDTINFSAELFYKRSNNEIQDISYPLTSSLMQVLPENIATNQKTGVDLSVWLKFKKYWIMSLSSVVGHTYYKSGTLAALSNSLGERIERQQYGAKNKLVFSYRNKKLFNLGLYVYYDTKEVTFEGYNKSYLNLNIAMSRRFFDDDLFINLAYQNFYSTSKNTVEKYLGIYTNSEYKDFYSHEPYFRIYLYYIFRSGDKGTKDIKL